jgi:hypothetical protein
MPGAAVQPSLSDQAIEDIVLNGLDARTKQEIRDAVARALRALR